MSPATCQDGRMNRAAAALYLGLSISWLVHAEAIGSGPASVHIGRRVWYFRADLDAFVQSNRRESKCRSSVTAARSTGGADSRLPADHIESALGRQIAARLRSKSDACARSEKPRHLIAVPQE